FRYACILAVMCFFFFSSRRRHTRSLRDWSSDVCSSDLGWDYLNLDGAGRRLLISHGTKVVVFDLKSDAVVGEIADTPGVHGAVMASEGHIFTSNGRENKASVVDAKTLQTIQKIETQGNPD